MTTDIDTARRILGNDFLGAEAVRSVFGAGVTAPPIPYTTAELETAVTAGECLVLRIDRDVRGPLTLLRLIERSPAAFDARFLRKMGYLLKEEWGIELEPLAATATCTNGWMLVRKRILDETRNLTYDEQTSALADYAAALHVAPAVLRRRTAVEIAYDLIVYHAACGERLLRDAWDWSASATIDAGYLNIGGFSDQGMQILSYSPAVRHGALGMCPARLPVRS